MIPLEYTISVLASDLTFNLFFFLCCFQTLHDRLASCVNGVVSSWNRRHFNKAKGASNGMGREDLSGLDDPNDDGQDEFSEITEWLAWYFGETSEENFELDFPELS